MNSLSYQGLMRDHQEGRTITVHGTGQVLTRPDAASAQIGFVNQDTDIRKAQGLNSSTIQKITNALIQAGIPQENIQTAEYSVTPQYEYIDGKQVFRGYEVSHILAVTIDDVDQTGYVIDTAVSQGANRINRIQFTLKRPQAAYQKALQIALGNALASAQTIANSMNLKLDQTPVRIIEKNGGRAVPRSFAQAEMVSSGAAPIEPGELKTSAQVEVKFQYYS
ncbi:SIMPL domain-containing protein [Halobacillus halophilus]|uniref:SIMPL domain-containing protein n=1 Tax=Halobacillus halophilus TaxID=1570 RepID=UPI001CD3F0EA|nr:SIMPL domain-containing protein [Halobacillus halophilus]MCA1011557.1 SIMPL domain-containing protein [Halobacillus halophilus]